LEFKDVSVTYPNGFRAVRGASFHIGKDDCLAIVGESGSGKTTLVKAALGILPTGAKVSGSIKFNETEIIGASEKTLRQIRGLVAGFVAQEPFSAFNPIFSVLDHIKEVWRFHGLKPQSEKIYRSLENAGIENAAEKTAKYPFEWSGGMLQRATITAAAALRPQIIIADEPTSALDADRADLILNDLRSTGATLLLISHDISLVSRYAEKIAVFLNGEIVEIGETAPIFENPRHEYTKKLIACHLHDKVQLPERSDNKIILEAKNLSKNYGTKLSPISAVKKADITVSGGEMIGICGASGSGKSTLWRMLSMIEAPSVGEIFLENTLSSSGESKKLLNDNARKGFIMPIFQDPFSSLDKNWKIWQIITEPLNAKHRTGKFSKAEKIEIARKILAEVGLSEINADAKPSQLSVGQCQRIAIARAVAAQPKMIAADEPTSALDSQTAVVVMKLFRRIAARGTAIVIVSHNEPLLKSYCHSVLRMREGVLEN
jgi:peptide/nickel transport system ATP-binding protein